MESAKNAISSLLGRDGKHHTDVDENVNPAVTSEVVKPHRHEEVTEAVDREIHQDHYHTTVQPLQHKEKLPEQHQHNIAPQVEREFHHGNAEEDRSRVAADLGQFRDTSTTHETTHSTAAAPSVAGEHVHHHVHERVQPVIHKETIQPEVVHTTVPIHEKHIAPSEHHGLSQLPTKTMDEFKGMGTPLTGGSRTHEEYDGHPRPYSAEMQVERKPVDINPRAHLGTHDPEKTGHFNGSHGGSSGTTGAVAGAAAAAGGHHHHDHEHQHQHQQGDHSLSGREQAMGTGVAGVGAGSVARDLGRDHNKAHEVSGLDSNDTKGTFGDAGATTAGTALAGRAEGNTVSNAASAATGRNTHDTSPAERLGSNRDVEREPTNLTGNIETPKKNIPSDDHVQHASQQGEDPSLDSFKGSKLTGTGQDGSHSAVFGLTPDGHKYKDTKNTHSSSMPKPTEEASKHNPENPGNDTSSRAPDSAGVAEQLDDPRVAEKGHGGKAEYSESNDKPGAGTF